MHGHDRVTAINCLQSDRLITGGIEYDTVPCIRKSGRTYIAAFGDTVNWVHAESHRHDRVAISRGLQGNVLCTCSGKDNCIPSVRQLALTNGLGVAHRISRINSQSHRHHRVTAGDSRQGHHLRTSLGKLYAVPGVRQLALANGLGIAHRIGW